MDDCLSLHAQPKAARWAISKTRFRPFYVRVFATGRCWIGDFDLNIHAHRGVSQEDAITLMPATPESYEMPSTPLNMENAVWYKFTTDASEKGLFPELDFMVDYAVSADFTFVLLDGSSNPIGQAGRQNMRGGGMRASFHHKHLPT